MIHDIDAPPLKYLLKSLHTSIRVLELETQTKIFPTCYLLNLKLGLPQKGLLFFSTEIRRTCPRVLKKPERIAVYLGRSGFFRSLIVTEKLPPASS